MNHLIYRAGHGESIHFNPATCCIEIKSPMSGRIVHNFTTEGYCLLHKSWECKSDNPIDEELERAQQIYGWSSQ